MTRKRSGRTSRSSDDSPSLGRNRGSGRQLKNANQKQTLARRRRQQPRYKSGGNKGDSSTGKRINKPNQRPHRRGFKNNERPSRGQSLTNTITVARSSIHNAWKKDLGGLIRWYVNLDGKSDDVGGAIKTIENIYTSRNCDVQATREALLQLIASETYDDEAKSRPTNEWLDIRMVVENPFLPETTNANAAVDNGSTIAIGNITYDTIVNGKGIVLKTSTRPGDGPAHACNLWTVVTIPRWAVGRPFYFEGINRSPLDLSCEMTIDGHSVAKNAPLSSHTRRTIRPALQRYFERHEWRIVPAQRIPFQQLIPGHASSQQPPQQQNPSPSSGPSRRYNGVRPSNIEDRVSYENFPDPTDYGWKFTGSHEESRVEFFEKRLNNGSICRMDLYYTTGTVKTTLYHPGQKKTTQLFRRCLATDPDVYRQILRNPRYHSNVGYRYRGASGQEHQNKNGPQDPANVNPRMLDEGDDDRMDEDDVVADLEMSSTYFAKNDNYEFDTAGHFNREAAMSQLQPTPEYQAWEQATRQDWACVHAKCYVSLPRYINSSNGNSGRNVENKDERMELPEMTPIANIQAAQNATLSTEFHSTGQLTNMPRKSRVRMERVKGLNDDPEWGTGPVSATGRIQSRKD